MFLVDCIIIFLLSFRYVRIIGRQKLRLLRRISSACATSWQDRGELLGLPLLLRIGCAYNPLGLLTRAVEALKVVLVDHRRSGTFASSVKGLYLLGTLWLLQIFFFFVDSRHVEARVTIWRNLWLQVKVKKLALAVILVFSHNTGTTVWLLLLNPSVGDNVRASLRKETNPSQRAWVLFELFISNHHVKIQSSNT